MLQIALILPAPDVEALIQGRTIAAIPGLFLTPGKQFVLYPADASANALPLDKYYRSGFVPTALSAQNLSNAETVLIKAWAKCELCQRVDNSDFLEALSRLTVWTTEALQEILQQQPHIFLAYLRVYQLHQPIEVSINPEIQQKIGRFVGLPVSLNFTDSSPVLSDRLFSIRRHQLENRLPPPHPELEELQGAIGQLSLTNPAAKQLDEDLKIFMGWRKTYPAAQLDHNLAWIKTIAEVGNSSGGQAFEKLVRKALIKLGFTNSNRNPKASLDPEATGGAGGLDFYCEAPYQVVGECKASSIQQVPTDVCSQLTYLGQAHLKKEYKDSIKIIIAAGSLNSYTHNIAVGNKMNVICPETLEKLIELKAKYPGSINLLELKPYLETAPFGEEADVEINKYIERVWQRIKLRSLVIEAVKEYHVFYDKKPTSNQVLILYNATFGKDLEYRLTSDRVTHDLLVELSSPLTGYLGRDEGSDWESDRFYFLRDLNAD